MVNAGHAIEQEQLNYSLWMTDHKRTPLKTIWQFLFYIKLNILLLYELRMVFFAISLGKLKIFLYKKMLMHILAVLFIF